MKIEERERVYEVNSKLVAGWMEFALVIRALEKEGVDVEELKKGKAMIQEGLETILVSIKEE